MELEDLQKFVLVMFFVGMIIGVGVLTLDKYSRVTRTATSLVDGSVNVSSGAATLSQTYCQSLGTITNTTGTAFNAATYNVSFTNADTCAITSDLPVHMLYNVSFTYGATTATQVAADAVASAISAIATNWMSLIITVAVLAIILVMVIRSFGGFKR